MRKEQPGYAGIAPRLLDGIFEQLEATGNRHGVACSMLEIYCEQVSDLLLDVSTLTKRWRSRSHSPRGNRGDDTALSAAAAYDHLELSTRKPPRGQRPKSPSLSMFGGLGEDMHVDGAVEIPVATAAEAKLLLDRGMRNRVTAATLCNRASSRGHAIFIITMQQYRDDGTRITSQIYLCDLAGSEKIGKTGAEGIRLTEASKINTSLLALRKVINMLALMASSPEKECPKGQHCSKFRSRTCPLRHTHIPYRDSKLTRLLQNALGGQGRTSVVCTINPKRSEAEETVSTLRFGTAAKSVVNSVVANVKARSHAEWTAMLAEKVYAIRELKHHIAELRQAGEGGGSGGGGGRGGAGLYLNPTGAGAGAPPPAPPPPVARCPLTGKPMVNPVVAADGHSYERAAIVAHFREAGLYSPVTRTRLPTAMVFPNHALRTLCAANGGNGRHRNKIAYHGSGDGDGGGGGGGGDEDDEFEYALGLLEQPTEIMVLIFQHLRASDLCSLSETCSQLRGFVAGDAAPAERKMLWSAVACREFAGLHARLVRDAAERTAQMARQGKGDRSLAARGLVQIELTVISSMGGGNAADGGGDGSGGSKTIVVRKEDAAIASAFDDGYQGFAVLLKQFPKEAPTPAVKVEQLIQLGGTLKLRYAA